MVHKSIPVEVIAECTNTVSQPSHIFASYQDSTEKSNNAFDPDDGRSENISIFIIDLN